MATLGTDESKPHEAAKRDPVVGHPDFEVASIPIDQIDLQPDRPRRAEGGQDMDDLVESVKSFGLSNPILVIRQENGRYEVRSGERRINVCKHLGHSHIPALIATLEDDAVIGLLDNFLHERLPALDEALWLAELKGKHGLTDERLAAMLGRGRSGVTQMLGVAKLPAALLDEVRALPEPPCRDHLIQLAQCADAERQNAVLEKIKEGATQQQLRKVRKGAPAPENTAIDANVAAVRRAIGRALKCWNDPVDLRASWTPTRGEAADIRQFIRLLQGLIKTEAGAADDVVAAPDHESSASLH